MSRILTPLIVALLASASASALASEEAKASEGKGLFMKYKCNSCHSVAVAHIKKTKTSSGSSKHKPPDLSGVGLEREPEWMEGYLIGEETILGRHHPSRFKGTEDQRETLVAWLETLKTPKQPKSESMDHHGDMGDTTHAK